MVGHPRANVPRATKHEHAEAAAEAAEAAAAQDSFWEMHDHLFENQQRLHDEDLQRYAEELGLDVKRFEREMAEHVYADRVHEDFLGGIRSGVNGTPTFYINGDRYDDSYEPDDLVAALEQAVRQGG
jgi:protein-disulfide isomerase